MALLEDLFQKIKAKDAPRGPIEERWLIVGLGNPGPKYEHNWHNLGYLALDTFAQKHHVKVNRIRFKGLTGSLRVGKKEILLLKPTTYMNCSGESVKEAADFYKIPPERILVLVDDIDLNLGVLRLREKGSHAHHNGLKSIIQHLQTEQFPRLRFGFGPQNRNRDMVDIVMSDIPKHCQTVVFEQLNKAADHLLMIVEEGVHKAQSSLNGQASQSLLKAQESDKKDPPLAAGPREQKE